MPRPTPSQPFSNFVVFPGRPPSLVRCFAHAHAFVCVCMCVCVQLCLLLCGCAMGLLLAPASSGCSTAAVNAVACLPCLSFCNPPLFFSVCFDFCTSSSAAIVALWAFSRLCLVVLSCLVLFACCCHLLAALACPSRATVQVVILKSHAPKQLEQHSAAMQC